MSLLLWRMFRTSNVELTLANIFPCKHTTKEVTFAGVDISKTIIKSAQKSNNPVMNEAFFWRHAGSLANTGSGLARRTLRGANVERDDEACPQSNKQLR